MLTPSSSCSRRTRSIRSSLGRPMLWPWTATSHGRGPPAWRIRRTVTTLVGIERAPTLATRFALDRVPAAVEAQLLEAATKECDRTGRDTSGRRMATRGIVQPAGVAVEADGLVEFDGRACVVIGGTGGGQHTHRHGHQRVECRRGGQAQRGFGRRDVGHELYPPPPRPCGVEGRTHTGRAGDDERHGGQSTERSFGVRHRPPCHRVRDASSLTQRLRALFRYSRRARHGSALFGRC